MVEIKHVQLIFHFLPKFIIKTNQFKVTLIPVPNKEEAPV